MNCCMGPKPIKVQKITPEGDPEDPNTIIEN
jgi:hypothetical protein